MCIAIVTTAGKSLTETNIRKAQGGNRDGGGMAYILNGKVRIEKGFMSADTFITRYMDVIRNGAAENPMLVHFRIATTGIIAPANCHPFKVGRGEGNGAMIHNGSFYSGKFDAEKSDTRVLAERQCNNFTYPALRAALIDMEREVGSYNKLAFLFDDAKYIIINERQGTWVDGVWYSNSWYKPDNGSGNTGLGLVPGGCSVPRSGPDI